MRRYLFLLALAVACGSQSHGDGDDDDDGAGAHAGASSANGGTAAKGGRAGSGSAGASDAGSTSGKGPASAGASSSSAGTTAGSTGGAAGRNGVGGTSGSGHGASANGGLGGEREPSAGMSGAGADGGSDSSEAGRGGEGGSFNSGGAGGDTNGANLPVVELLIDGSSSMFLSNDWDLIYESLVTDGVLAAFEGALNLGLAVYHGHQATSETDPTCATWTDVSFADDNGGEIGDALAAVADAYNSNARWETPTGHAVNVAAHTLAGYVVPGGVRKYILLITDGAPNTCVKLDPQCGQDLAVAAVQAARASGVTTLVVGVGGVVPDSGCPASARCGDEHLQDIANAGAGLPVEPPSDNYRFEVCVENHTLVASYAAVGGGGSATFYSSEQSGGLTARLTAALTAIAAGTVP